MPGPRVVSALCGSRDPAPLQRPKRRSVLVHPQWGWWAGPSPDDPTVTGFPLPSLLWPPGEETGTRQGLVGLESRRWR